jgi:outer membrane protein assembly factor BamB
MLRAGLALALMGLIANVWADEIPEITELKPLYVETALVTAGAASCVIAIPDDEAYKSLAHELAAAIAATCGAAPEVQRAGALADEAIRQTNIIALGWFANNAIVDRLYRRSDVICNLSWPGGEGAYVIRSVHDPWLSGRNVIYIGSVTPEGCAAGVKRFIEIMQESKGGSVGHIIEVHGKATSARPDEKTIAEAEAAIANETTSGSMARLAASYINNYFTSGYEEWAQLLLPAMRKLENMLEADGAADDLRSCRYIFSQYDRMDECPAFGPAERLELDNVFLHFMCLMPYAQKPIEVSEWPHGNNWNATAAGLAALYFVRHYPEIEIGQRLLASMDTYYEPNMANWKVAEDCPGYGKITMDGDNTWALNRPHDGYFETGVLEKMADYWMMITNNMGKVSGFGDSSGLGDRKFLPNYPLAAWVYRDGRYLWWYDRHGGSHTGFWVPPDVIPRRRPDDLLGLRKAPLDEWIYNRPKYLSWRTFPLAECYDKVTFRSGFEADDQYMCMSGFCYGGHSHEDANAIVHYSDRGETRLYDDGYMIPTLSEHNTVTILKDGWAGTTPAIAQVTAEAEFEDTAIFASRMNNYNGVNWERAVIWPQGRYFLIVDTLECVDQAEYGFQCIWRTLGNATLEGRRLKSDKGTGQFNLIAASDAVLARGQSAGTSLSSQPFPLTEASALIEAAKHKMEPGDVYRFGNLFYTSEPGDAGQRVDCYRGGDGTTYLVRDDGEPAAAGVSKCTVVAGTEIVAHVFHLTEQRLTASGAELVTIGGQLLSATGPVNVQIDLGSGEAQVQAAAEIEVTYAAPDGAKTETLKPGPHVLKLRPVEAAARRQLAASLEKGLQQGAASVQVAEAQAADTGEGVSKLWKFVVPAGAAAGENAGEHMQFNALETADVNADGKSEIYAGGTDNAVYAVGADGSLIWKYPVGGPVNALTVAHSAGTGEYQIVAACDDQTMYSIKPDGTESFTVTPPPRSYARAGYRNVKPFQGSLRVIFSADIDGDEDAEIIIGSANWRTYVYDHMGHLVWDEVCWAHNPTCGAAFDLDGDGTKEIIMGNSYIASPIYSSTGELIGEWGGVRHSGATAVSCADLDGNGKGEIVVGDRGGRIWFKEWEGRRLSVLSTGSDITAIGIGDIDAGEKLETAVASKNYILYIFDADSKLLRQVNLLTVCRDIAVGDVLGDEHAEIVCACEDGTVKILNGQGEIVRWYQAPAWVRHVAICELDGDAKTKEIVATCDDGSIYGLQVRE